MAKLDATLSEIQFTGELGYNATLESNEDSFVWNTPTGHRVTAFGTDFTYSIVYPGIPAGGTVNEFAIDFIDGEHLAGTTDATITDLSVSLEIATATDAGFWAAVLGGNDTILAPIHVGGALFGDFLKVDSFRGGPSLTMTGGYDTLSSQAVAAVSQNLNGEGVFANVLAGDALKVYGSFFPTQSSATLNGGDDKITVAGASTYAVVGDAQLVGGLAILNGGDDTITSDARFNTSLEGFVGHYFGDAELSYWKVNGGHDVITGSNSIFASEHLVGDVYRQREEGVTAGGDDLISGRKGQDTIAGDVFYLSSGELIGGNDTIFGGNGADLISGDVLACRETGIEKVSLKITGGHDTIDGGAGDDYITGDIYQPVGLAPGETFIAGSDTLLGGAGDDTIYGDSFFDALVDVGGDDRINGGLGDDKLDGGFGFDTLFFDVDGPGVTVDLSGAVATGQGTDSVVGFETVEGTNSDDNITGSAFSDALFGLSGDDVLRGLGGDNSLYGGLGSDALYGGGGRDEFISEDDNANDVFAGGKGVDGIDAEEVSSSLTLTFNKANSGVLTSITTGTDSFRSIKRFDLSSQDDFVGAGAGSNIIDLESGNDVADGGRGKDVIYGDDGDDRLNGGLGNDKLFGGIGVDTFVFDTALDGVNNVDIVFDYSLAGDYPIELGSAVFTGLALGTLRNAAFRAGAGVVAATDASDRIIYDTSTGDLYFDVDGLGGIDAVKFAVFSNLTGLAAFSFTVV